LSWAPAPADLPGETAPRTELDVDGLRIIVLGVEDCEISALERLERETR